MLLQVKNMESGGWRRPISLAVDTGETVLLLGRNGAGKSTLLNTIAGLTPVRSGQIIIDGTDLQGRRPQVGIALEGRRVFGRLSVQKNLLLGAYCLSNNNAEENLEWILSLFPDLRGKLNLPAKTLSGGQQTMLSIGRALMGRPKLLLMDEPTLGLSPQTVDKLIQAVMEIEQKRNVAMIIAEHSGQFAQAFSQRIVLMIGGEIVFDGNWNEAQKGGMLADVFA